MIVWPGVIVLNLEQIENCVLEKSSNISKNCGVPAVRKQWLCKPVNSLSLLLFRIFLVVSFQVEQNIFILDFQRFLGAT